MFVVGVVCASGFFLLVKRESKKSVAHGENRLQSHKEQSSSCDVVERHVID